MFHYLWKALLFRASNRQSTVAMSISETAPEMKYVYRKTWHSAIEMAVK